MGHGIFRFTSMFGFLGVSLVMFSSGAFAQTGSVSGTVFDAEGNGIENVDVQIQDDKCGGNRIGDTKTDANGEYQIDGLSPGDVYASVGTGSVSDYYIAYRWDGDSGTLNCNEKAAIPVQNGQVTPNIDFVLPKGGAARGTITDENGDPLENARMTFYSGSCNSGWLASGKTDVNGEYFVRGIMAGEVYAKASADDLPRSYLPLHYNGNGATFDCTAGTTLPINEEETRAGPDIQLALGGTIGGTVTTSSGAPVSDGRVQVMLEQCGDVVVNAATNTDGTYTTSGLPEGNVYLRTWTGSSDNTDSDYFIDEHYDGQTGTTNCNNGTTVAVTAEQATNDIDFELAVGAAASGALTDKDGQPVTDVTVTARDAGCEGSWLASRRTEDDGSFTVRGIDASGEVFIVVDDDDVPAGTAQTFWDGKSGSYFCREAMNIEAVTGETTADINFVLYSTAAADFVQRLLTEIKTWLKMAKKKKANKKTKAARKSVKDRTKLVRSTVKDSTEEVGATLPKATKKNANKTHKAAKRGKWGALKRLIKKMLKTA